MSESQSDYRYDCYNFIFQKALPFIGMGFVTVIDPRCTTITVLACFVYHKRVTLTGLQALCKCNVYF